MIFSIIERRLHELNTAQRWFDGDRMLISAIHQCEVRRLCPCAATASAAVASERSSMVSWRTFLGAPTSALTSTPIAIAPFRIGLAGVTTRSWSFVQLRTGSENCAEVGAVLPHSQRVLTSAQQRSGSVVFTTQMWGVEWDSKADIQRQMRLLAAALPRYEAPTSAAAFCV